MYALKNKTTSLYGLGLDLLTYCVNFTEKAMKFENVHAAVFHLIQT